MQTDNRIFDDFARLTNSLLGVATGMRGEVEGVVKARLQALLADMDLVSRDEFEAVKAVAAKARTEQEKLEKRVAELEAALAAKAKPAAKAASKKGRDASAAK
jgi:BMFP domain-containing protein YqiC